MTTEPGQAPVTGGRTRQYASDAERSRAWRERRRADGEAGVDRSVPARAGRVVTAERPELAAASLAAVVPALRQVLDGARIGFAEQVERVEAAIELLSDPEAIDGQLESARAEAARLVAEAESTSTTARQDAARARRESEQAQADAQEAQEAADAATRELAAAEERAGAAEFARVAAAEDAEQSFLLAQGLREELAGVRSELEGAHAEHAEALTVLRAEVKAAREAGRSAAHDRDVERARHEAAEQAAQSAAQAARAEHAAALEQLRSAAEARQDAAVASAREVLQARLDAAGERLKDERARVAELREERDTWRETATRKISSEQS